MARKKVEHNAMTDDEREAFEHAMNAMRVTRERVRKIEAMGMQQLDSLMAEDLSETPKTYEDWLDAVSSSCNYGRILKFVPQEFMTPELCLAAVHNEGTALEFVPEALKTRELCAAAVAVNWHALEYVPDALKTTEMCLTAVLACELAREYVPEKLADSLVKKVSNTSQDGDYLSFYNSWFMEEK